MVQISEHYVKAPPERRPATHEAFEAGHERDSLGITLALGLFVFATVFAAASLFV